MEPSTDHLVGARLGEILRRDPTISSQQLQALVQDLLGQDLSLRAPLRELLLLPSFKQLSQDLSPAQAMAQRDALLAELARTFHPDLLQRLRSVLDGLLELKGESDAYSKSKWPHLSSAGGQITDLRASLTKPNQTHLPFMRLGALFILASIPSGAALFYFFVHSARLIPDHKAIGKTSSQPTIASTTVRPDITSKLPTKPQDEAEITVPSQIQYPATQNHALSPGEVLIINIENGDRLGTRWAKGELRYNNGNTIKGLFFVDCKAGTMEPRNFVFTSKNGDILKSGQYWSPPFNTKWGVEFRLVSQTCADR